MEQTTEEQTTGISLPDMNAKFPRGVFAVELVLVLSLAALTSLVVAHIVTPRVFALLVLAVAAVSGLALYRSLKRVVPRSDKVDSAKAAKPIPRGGICYIFGVFSPLVYLLFMRRDRQHPFLRFHCFQSLLLFTLLIPVEYWKDHHRSNVAGITALLLIIGWLVAMVQAERGQRLKLPVLGNVAARFASGGSPKLCSWRVTGNSDFCSGTSGRLTAPKTPTPKSPPPPHRTPSPDTNTPAAASAA